MKHGVERITAHKAETYLNRNNGNRKMRDGVAEKYAADMKAGRWTECAAPIVFYDNGDVADGQHRLWAIVLSGVTQEFLVVRDFPRDAGLNIDTGLGRSLLDNARISGIDAGLSNEMISYARAAEGGAARRGALSNSARLDLVNKHREAVTWVIANGPKGRFLRNAVTMAAIVRAWYREDDELRLRRFCDVLTGGFADGAHESAAIAIRNYLMSKGQAASSTAIWGDTFLKVQNAIKHFMAGKPLTVIRSVNDEAYPLKRQRRSA